MKAAFVIGGTGLVGRALVDALLADGVRVVALARTPAATVELREAGAEVLPTDLAGAWTWRADHRADAAGRFAVQLPPGTVSVAVYRVIPGEFTRWIDATTVEVVAGKDVTVEID